MFLREIGKAVKIESVTSIVSCAVNGAAWGAGLVMIIMERPLHNPENFAVVRGENFRMTLVMRFFGRK